MNEPRLGLYHPTAEHSSCGVGFITRKSGVPDHDVIRRGHRALCAIPHRGGMSSEGVGDGAGVSIDLSASFFGALVGRELAAGRFGVCNVLLPDEESEHEDARRLVRETLTAAGLTVELERELPVDDRVIRAAAVRYQKAIVQWVFTGPAAWQRADLDRAANRALLEIEQHAYGRPELTGLYPLSLGTRTQVLKGRLNANEVIPYFVDLLDERHTVRTL